ncbi:MAG: hypothetical protein US58_C0022G0016 [Candidatus Magasanikbacteria bacterium GW2011_GWA2_37_8]|uniref:DUF2304 domain-containing protein n=1 Tax=Candidatus Magasanikbacteria bacterium GW2011_GWA2_37_8 TaxID=1619036 RepID=A0A0G0HDJ7_9BACT|nr:MAG: hypothetical protein US58_C0022G0016 [Candidatus Magasanikbacteria bacterium GW2011_GWA2_37_8]
MLLIQLILPLFFIFAITKVIVRIKATELSVRQGIVWVVFWILAGVVVIEPNSTIYFAHLLGIGRGADLIIYFALAILFYLFFRQTVQVEKMKREITQLTRRETLNKK